MFAYKIVPKFDRSIGHQEYIPGVVYTYSEPITKDEYGFNAVTDLNDYTHNSLAKRFLLVRLLGDVHKNLDNSLSTNKIEIVKEIECPMKSSLNGSRANSITLDHFRSRLDFNAVTVFGSDGSNYRYKNNLLHGDGASPAIVTSKGDMIWMHYGVVHRDGLPAYVSHTHCTQLWYKYNKLHRENDLPAAEYPDDREWWIEGKQHRDGDRPAVINGRSSDCLEWWVDDKRHRAGGQPAVLWKNGPEEYWENGVQYYPNINNKKRIASDLGLPARSGSNNKKLKII